MINPEATELFISPQLLQSAQDHLDTIRDFIRFGVSSLRQSEAHLGQGTEDYFAESSALVLQSISLDWSADPDILDAKLLPEEKQQILALFEQRINQHIPTSYLLNLAYFAGHAFYVDERVLIPRSPIAELIQTGFAPYFAADQDPELGLPMAESDINSPNFILDLCTGSGCIAIALAYAFEEAQIDAIDLSKEALEVASINIEHHQKEHQINILESNLFDKVAAANQYDLIVSNPPYVNAEDMADLPAEFEHEPEMALAAGQDGLDLVRLMLATAADYLSENGLIVIEVGNSAWALQQNFPKVDFHWLQFKRGGQGVFALTAAQCKKYQQMFVQASTTV